MSVEKDKIFRVKVWRFAVPYYDDRDIMHGFKHLERVLKEAESLASVYLEADRDIVFAACCFHGFISTNEEKIGTFLRGF